MHDTRRVRIRLASLALSMFGLTIGAPAAQGPAPAVTLGTLAGWEFVADPPVAAADVCVFAPNGVAALAGKPTGYLVTTSTHTNYRLHIEWRWPGTPGNSGVLVHIASGPKAGAWPACFQIQMKHTAVGDLLPMAGATFAEPLSTPPDAKTPLLAHRAPDNEKPAGEWNTCDIVCLNDTIEVIVNGVVQNRVTGVSVSAGKVGFQFEGAPYELRNVSLTPLASAPSAK